LNVHLQLTKRAIPHNPGKVTAKDAKETTIEQSGAYIQNSLFINITLYIRERLSYFAPLASFAVRLYKVGMTRSIEARAVKAESYV
jgi:hypothetical protein